MDISVRTKDTFTGSSHRWVGKTQALKDADTITLHRASFDLVTDFPNGVIPSGVCLGRIGTGPHTGKYGPYDDTQVEGRETAVGFLAEDVPYDRDSTADMGGALMWWGEVVEGFLPTNHGLDAAGKTELAAKFRFV